MRPRNLGLIAGLAALLVASTASAAWMDDFSGDLSAWTIGNPTGTGGTSHTFTAGRGH